MNHDPSPSVPDSLREQAARLLASRSAIARLSLDDARRVVDTMVPAFVAAGALVFEEGDTQDNDFMVLLLEGEVRAESAGPTAADDTVYSVLGPGSLLGEIGLVDGGPRSARCEALTDLKLAVLSREALLGLIGTHPAVAARLLLALCGGIAEHLRDNNRRLRTQQQISAAMRRDYEAMRRELDAAHAINRRLLDGRP